MSTYDEPTQASNETIRMKAPGIDVARAQVEAAQQRRVALIASQLLPESAHTQPPRAARTLPGYTLLRELHRGGQGVVWIAVQESTGREVAVKLLRQGSLASPAEMARFDREVEVLGRLKHPNIVTIHDCGRADADVFLVMDYVPGRALDAHVEHERLSVRQILGLFAKICDGVNAAHLRGVIHRDLKPSNIRVDEHGEPRVLDFGLAKLMEEQDAGSEPAMTLTGQFVGSLPWASPEQAEGRSDLLDIRTDVYSLGVVLYQLLTRRFPYPVTGRMDDVVRHIMQSTPVRPSTLDKRIEDDVEIILLKSLAKQAERRYQSAGELARDIRHHLANEAIEARRYSVRYVVSRYVARHRFAAMGTAAFLLVLLVSLAVSLTFWRRTQIALAHAREQSGIAQAVNDFLNNDLLASVRPEILGREATIRAALDAAARRLGDRFNDQPAVKARLHTTLGLVYRELGELSLAATHLESALNLRGRDPGAWDDNAWSLASDLSVLYDQQGRYAETEKVCRACVEYSTRVMGPQDWRTCKMRGNLGWALFRLGQSEEAERLVRQARDCAVGSNGRMDKRNAPIMNTLAVIVREAGRYEEAEGLQREALEVATESLGSGHPQTLTALNNLAELNSQLGRYDQAEGLYLDALEGRRQILGPTHPSTLLTLNSLAVLYGRMGRYADGIPLYREGLRGCREKLPEEHPTVVNLLSNMGFAYDKIGQHADAEPLHQAAIRGARKWAKPDPNLGVYLNRLAYSLLRLDCLDEAETALLEAYDILEKAGGHFDDDARECATGLAKCCELTGRSEEAAIWRARAVADVDL